MNLDRSKALVISEKTALFWSNRATQLHAKHTLFHETQPSCCVFFAQIKAKRIAFVGGSLAVTIKPALLGVLGQ